MITVIGVTTATRSTTLHTTTVTLKPILMPALLLCEFPLVARATMARMRAGMEIKRQMINAPHVNKVQRKNTRAHIAIPEWFSLVVVAVTGCAATMTVALASCGW